MRFLLKLFIFLFKMLCSIALALSSLIIFAALYIHFADLNQYKDAFVQVLEKSLHQKVKVQGPFEILLFPLPKIKLNDAQMILIENQYQVFLKFKSISFNVPWPKQDWIINKIQSVHAQEVSVQVKEHKHLVFDKAFNQIDAKLISFDLNPKVKDLHFDYASFDTHGDISFLSKENKIMSVFQFKKDKMNAKVDVALLLHDNLKGTVHFTFSDVGKDAQGDLKFSSTDNRWLSSIEMNSKNWVFSSQNSDWIPEFKETDKIDLSWNIENLNFNQDIIQKVKLNFKSEHLAKQLNLQSNLFGGEFKANLQLSDKTSERWLCDVRLNNANASELLSKIKQNHSLQGGKLSIILKGSTHFDPKQNFFQTFKGKALLQIYDLTIRNQEIDTRYVDLFAALFKKAKSKSSSTIMQCLVCRAQMSDGIIDFQNNLAIETPDLIILGGGKAKLSDQLAIILKMRPKREINIEIGAFTNTISITGSVNAPEIQMDPKGLIQEGGSVALGFATGGLSFLAEKLYKIASKNPSPCKTLLGDGEL